MGLFSKLFKSNKNAAYDYSTPLGNTPSYDYTNPYSIRLSDEELRAIEGTTSECWFLENSDTRTKEQLHLAVAQALCIEYFCEYEFMENVSPLYFGENPACKPLDFMLLKDGVPVLAINVVPYTGISHPAIKNIRNACEARGIKYFHLIIGYPNTEHYIVRRALEELGVVPYLY